MSKARFMLNNLKLIRFFFLFWKSRNWLNNFYESFLKFVFIIFLRKWWIFFYNNMISNTCTLILSLWQCLQIFSNKTNWAYSIHLFSLNLLFHITRLDFKRKVIFHQISFSFFSKCILIAMILVFIYLFCLLWMSFVMLMFIP